MMHSPQTYASYEEAQRHSGFFYGESGISMSTINVDGKEIEIIAFIPEGAIEAVFDNDPDDDLTWVTCGRIIPLKD